jgi:hypothetical protein
MFKSEEYVGFEARPDLRALAERGTAALAGEIETWRARVSVRWTPAGDAIDLRLELALSNGVEATHDARFERDDFVRERRLASRCNRAWSELLGTAAEIQQHRIEETVLETVEA